MPKPRGFFLAVCLLLAAIRPASAQVQASNLDAREREAIAMRIGEHMTQSVARLASPTTFEYLRKQPDQVLPKRVTASLTASGLICVELGREFIPRSATDPIEFEAQMQWLHTQAFELVQQEVEIREIRFLFNNQPLEFYFPVLLQQATGPVSPALTCGT